MEWTEHLYRIWPHLVAGLIALSALIASLHALLRKRDSRAAVLWLGFIWLMPLLGPILYLSIGINRIRKRALSLRAQSPESVRRVIPPDMGEPHTHAAEHLSLLAKAVDRLGVPPLTGGNSAQVFINGDEAFPVMLEAIEKATRSVSLATYIFDRDQAGKAFALALGQAVSRGVEVRVLIDDAGARYSWPSIVHLLRHQRVKVARFLPTLAPWRLMTMNLRNHRKIMVVDGKLGFTGGINIRVGNLLKENPKRPVRDLHFQLEGPVVSQLQEAFANDWEFCTREVLGGYTWFPELPDRGVLLARTISDGPDADFEKLRWTLLAALAEAQTSVQILTPYFLPDSSLVTALNLAALRGVRVDIILPSLNNLPFVHWASRAMWWQVLARGCRIWLTPPPFDHSKLMVVDGHWVLLGSANWDARSLRLNFELSVECYGRPFAEKMAAVVRQKLSGAHEVTLAEVDGRKFLGKVRDAAARLFTPYL